MQKTCKKNATKNAKKKQNKCEKNTKKNKTNANCIFFAFFGGGFDRASNFSKLAKNLGKMQKKNKTNAKNMRKNAKKMRNKCKKNAKKMQILEMRMSYKNKFPEVAFLLAFLFAFFLHVPGPRFLGLHFLVAFFLLFFCILIKFGNL